MLPPIVMVNITINEIQPKFQNSISAILHNKFYALHFSKKKTKKRQRDDFTVEYLIVEHLIY